MADEIVKAKIVFEKGGLGGAAGISDGSANAGQGKGLAGAAGTKGMAGSVAKGMIAAQAVLGAIKKLTQKLVDSSPELQATLKIISKSIDLFLRPIALVINVFLRPMAIYMIKMARGWLKWFQEQKITEQIEAGMQAFAEDPAGNFNTAFDELINKIIDFDAAAFAEKIAWWFDDIVEELKKMDLGKKIPVMMVVLGQKLFEAIIAVLPFLYKWIYDAWGYIFDIWKTWGTMLWDGLVGILGVLWQGLVNIKDIIVAHAVAAWENLITDIMIIKVKMKQALEEWWDKVVERVSGFGKYIWKHIKKWWDNTIDGIKAVGNFAQHIWDTIVSWWETIINGVAGIVDWLVEGLKKAFQKILDAIPDWEEGKQNISDTFNIKKWGEVVDAHLNPGKNDFIMQNGAITPISKQDTVVGFNGRSPINGGNNITVNINALDSQSIDQRTIDRITQAIQMQLKRTFNNRSTEMYGV